MSDQALENAMKHRDSLAAKINAAQQEIDEWRREMARADAFIKDWHAFASGGMAVGEVADSAHFEGSVSERPRRRTSGNSSKEEVAEAAREVIEERGEPIGREELYKLLTERGLIIQGKDPEMVLSTMLWRMRDHIVRLRQGGYWLRDKPHEDSMYYPEIDDVVGTADDSDPSGHTSNETDEL